MIAVIADDLTGAAEIAGVGLQYGLKVTLELETVKKSNADLVIIATDTRSMSKDQAYLKIKEIIGDLLKFDYDWIFKKTDSVFRGHVLAESKAILDSIQKNKLLLVASNPQIGRKIINGKYFIDDIPLQDTGFAKDPEFPITTNDVFKLLGQDNFSLIHHLSVDSEIHSPGIYIGEASSSGDLEKMAEKVTTDIIPTGSAGFFEALLKNNGFKLKDPKQLDKDRIIKKQLIIRGSAYTENRNEILDIRDIFITYMPKEVFYATTDFDKSYSKWVETILLKLKQHDKLIVAMNEPVINERKLSHHLKNVLANLVKDVLEKSVIGELLIEGGATAYAIIKAIQLTQFYPIMQIAPGVIRMKVEENDKFYITLKPGSYPMPQILYTN